MKLKFFKPSDYRNKKDKERLFRMALREACIELTMEGNFKTYEAARKEMIKRAENNLK